MPTPAQGPLAPALTDLKECFTNRFYIWFFVATTLGLISFGPDKTFSVFHARSLGVSDDLYGKSLALAYGCSLILSDPLGILADRFHPIRVGLLGMGLYQGIMIFGWFQAHTASTFLVTFVLHTVSASGPTPGSFSGFGSSVAIPPTPRQNHANPRPPAQRFRILAAGKSGSA